ncbi:YggS family pyridoxal phosphate-dependent enzyme [Sphingobacterium sp. xlx-130]|uniref:YggS family pyridoxal phosphate-dependent enzyme n=1 Tax=Sphingobacterium sp. xlx-130 TaxID=2654323 RepID=UPI0013DAC442|nr:YggS family pyridoxal phosphate-dependent enzyme [Sphingobacterium sp. xlx-130]
MSNIVSNLNIILKRIERACLDSMRDPAEVKLLLATKTVPSERIKEALQEGQTLIAENKVQEIKEKYEDLRSIPHTSHFIGHLQSNKIKDILKYDISCIQSLDRLEIAEKLQQRLAYEDRKIDVLIQINTSGEQSKFGIHPDEAIELVKSVSEFDNIKIKGLMTIGLFSAEAEKVRPCFRLLKQIQQEIITEQIHNVNMHELSMGMSGDLETAIEEGSTIVRVGTAIFGPRIYANSYYWNESRLG